MSWWSTCFVIVPNRASQYRTGLMETRERIALDGCARFGRFSSRHA